MMKLAVVLLPTKKENDFVVNIRITEQRRSAYVSLGFKLRAEQFNQNAAQEWVIKHPDASLINRQIENRRYQAFTAICEADFKQELITIDEVKDILSGKLQARIEAENSFFLAVESRWKFYYENNNISDYFRFKKYRTYLEECWGRDYTFTQIKQELVEQYQTFRKKKGTASNTIRKEISDLGSVFSRKLPEVTNPFKEQLRLIRSVPIKKHKLTIEELSAIEKAPVIEKYALARDMFLFAYYAHGMRIENVLLLKLSDIRNGLIIYQMNKGKKHREIVIHPKLETLINQYKKENKTYLFPVIGKEPISEWDKRSKIGAGSKQVNEHLKVVGGVAQLGVGLTFHMARHSFAYNAMKKKVDMYTIKAAMGHSSLKTTETYLGSFNDDEVNENLKGLYQ